jgi:hypothetical protein
MSYRRNGPQNLRELTDSLPFLNVEDLRARAVLAQQLGDLADQFRQHGGTLYEAVRLNPDDDSQDITITWCEDMAQEIGALVLAGHQILRLLGGEVRG